MSQTRLSRLCETIHPLQRFAAVVLLLVASSCDDVPTFQELTGDRPEGKIPTQFAPEQAAAPPTGPPKVSSKPVIRTPQQILDDFLASDSRLRTNAHLEELSHLDEAIRQQVTVLDLKDSRVNDLGAPLLAQFPILEEIDLSGTAITNQGMRQVAKAKGLRKLTLDRMSIDGDGIAALADFEDLRELSLAGTPISDTSFEHLRTLNELEVLRVSGNSNLLGVGFNALVQQGAFPNLRELHAAGTGFGYYGLGNLRHVPGLEVLVVGDAQMSDQAILGIATCRNLRELDLSHNPIGNEALRLLARLRQLESLKIGGCIGVTDAGLNHLRGLKSLKVLELGNVRCSPGAVRTLKERFLTETEIHFQNEVF